MCPMKLGDDVCGVRFAVAHVALHARRIAGQERRGGAHGHDEGEQPGLFVDPVLLVLLVRPSQESHDLRIGNGTAGRCANREVCRLDFALERREFWKSAFGACDELFNARKG